MQSGNASITHHSGAWQYRKTHDNEVKANASSSGKAITHPVDGKLLTELLGLIAATLPAFESCGGKESGST